MKQYRLYQNRELRFALDINDYTNWSQQIFDGNKSIHYFDRPEIWTPDTAEYLLFNCEEDATVELFQSLGVFTFSTGVASCDYNPNHNQKLTLYSNPRGEQLFEYQGDALAETAEIHTDQEDGDYIVYYSIIVRGRNGIIPLYPFATEPDSLDGIHDFVTIYDTQKPVHFSAGFDIGE